jgi:malonate-semialdehyde dehydrogenase (acetylating) / methylmalonate-semialdehyde dehydrogenase
LDKALELVNRSKYGNQASLFASSGAVARRFQNEVESGNIGINIGFDTPMAFYSFGK